MGQFDAVLLDDIVGQVLADVAREVDEEGLRARFDGMARLDMSDDAGGLGAWARCEVGTGERRSGVRILVGVRAMLAELRDASRARPPSRGTIANWIADGTIPAWRDQRGRWCVEADALVGAVVLRRVRRIVAIEG